MWSFVFGSIVPERYSKKNPSLNFKSQRVFSLRESIWSWRNMHLISRNLCRTQVSFQNQVVNLWKSKDGRCLFPITSPELSFRSARISLIIFVLIGAFPFRHGQNDIEDGVQARVNGGYDGRYADSGPPSANGTNKFVQPRPQPEQQQQLQAAAAPPAYAVVDKSKKKKKKAEAEDPYGEVEDPKKVGKRSQA